MLGLTPSIFFKVDPRERQKHVFGDPQDIYVYVVGRRKTTKKKSVYITSLIEFKKSNKKSETKKVVEIIKKVISEQADKESVKSHEKCSL